MNTVKLLGVAIMILTFWSGTVAGLLLMAALAWLQVYDDGAGANRDVLVAGGVVCLGRALLLVGAGAPSDRGLSRRQACGLQRFRRGWNMRWPQPRGAQTVVPHPARLWAAQRIKKRQGVGLLDVVGLRVAQRGKASLCRRRPRSGFRPSHCPRAPRH